MTNIIDLKICVYILFFYDIIYIFYSNYENIKLKYLKYVKQNK